MIWEKVELLASPRSSWAIHLPASWGSTLVRLRAQEAWPSCHTPPTTPPHGPRTPATLYIRAEQFQSKFLSKEVPVTKYFGREIWYNFQRNCQWQFMQAADWNFSFYLSQLAELFSCFHLKCIIKWTVSRDCKGCQNMIRVRQGTQVLKMAFNTNNWSYNNKKCVMRCGGLVVSVPASRPPVPWSNLGPGGASPQCSLRGGRSALCNTVQIM